MQQEIHPQTLQKEDNSVTPQWTSKAGTHPLLYLCWSQEGHSSGEGSHKLYSILLVDHLANVALCQPMQFWAN